MFAKWSRLMALPLTSSKQCLPWKTTPQTADCEWINSATKQGGSSVFHPHKYGNLRML
jgi:hypothetical protein